MGNTKDYYKKNADSFIESTLEIDMNSIYKKFIPLLPEGGKILDAGCGSGRDSLFFKTKGFDVLAIDSCEEFVEFSRKYAGVESLCTSFNEIDFENEFDGIWACASILHLEQNDLSDALKRLAKALKYDGILYASFKYGDFSGEKNGRIFTDMNEKKFSGILKEIPAFELLETWITNDQRKERTEEKWLNVLVKLI